MLLLTQNNKDKFEQFKSAADTDGALVLIDKDKDWTSFDVVAKIRGLLKIKKVGHAGTLDPLATGLLILGCGRGTKELSEYQGLNKIYTGTIKIGAITKTDDAEGDEEDVKEVSHITLNDIMSAKEKFTGKIMQKPPMYSAKHVKGKRLYKLARKDVKIEVPEHEVEVHKFDITNYESPFIQFEIECSKGTYIRSLARDLGNELGVGGYLAELRRTAIGKYNVEDSFTIDEFSEILKFNS